MSDVVYVVFGNKGWYEDNRDWIIGIYTDLDTARTIADKHQEPDDDDDDYDDPVRTRIETWSLNDGSAQQMRTIFVALQYPNRDNTIHAGTVHSDVRSQEVDASMDVSECAAKWDQDYRDGGVRVGATHAEAKARLAEALADRVSA